MPKQTRLDEDAIIYQPREELSEKEKLSDMPLGQKFSYLREYYKFHALITIGVIAAAIYLIYNIVTPNIVPQFYAAIIGNTIDPNVLEEYKNDFTNILQLDPKTESVVLNASFNLNVPGDYTTKSVLVTKVSAKEIDVIIAPESTFKEYAYYGYMDKISDQLPTDIYSSLTDSFYISDLEDDPQKNVYGIYLTDTKLFKENANYKEPYVLGIIVNSKHKQNTVEFIRYLFNE